MKLRAEGATVYQFEGGEPYLNTPEFVKEAMLRALQENKTRYAPSSGVPELRAAIADKLRSKNNIPAQAGDVMVMNGFVWRVSVSGESRRRRSRLLAFLDSHKRSARLFAGTGPAGADH